MSARGNEDSNGLTMSENLKEIDRPEAPLREALETMPATPPFRETADPFFTGLLHLPPVATRGSKIIRDGHAKAVFEAERKVKEAESLANQIMGDITGTIAEAKSAGYAEGREEAKRELARELSRIERQAREFYEDAERTIADLAVEIAGRIIGKVTADPLLPATVREAIVRHTANDPYCIQVAMDTRAVAEAGLRQLMAERPGVRIPTVRVDARLPSGRAVLLTRFGSVDLDIESQLRAIRDSLTAGKVARDAGTGT